MNPINPSLFLNSAQKALVWRTPKSYGSLPKPEPFWGGVLKVLVKKGPLGIHFLKRGS